MAGSDTVSSWGLTRPSHGSGSKIFWLAMIAGHLDLIGIFQAGFMIANSLFDLRPAPLGLTVTRSYAQFSSQSFKG